jgi:hypothetical protein
MYNSKWSFIVTVIAILSIPVTILSSEESSEIGEGMEDNTFLDYFLYIFFLK